MKFTVAAIFLALFVSINAFPYAVIEVAKVASPVGSHGPALINLHWPNTWPGSYWGKGAGGWGGNAGYGGSSGSGGSGIGSGEGSGGDGKWGNGEGYGQQNDGYGNGNGWGYGSSGGSVGYTGDAGYHDGKYIAINRGSIHVAPLVGHTQSVKSANYQPAPGTTW